MTFGQIRGEMDVRHTFSRTPSQVLEDIVHIFLKKDDIAGRFVRRSLTREFGQDLRKSSGKW